MGRTKGRTEAPLFAVSVEALRRIDSLDALQPGEVPVRAVPRSLTKKVMPIPMPSDLAFEVWRLVKPQGTLTYGQVATTSKVARFLAHGSRAKDSRASRERIAKKHVARVKAFLRTPVGYALTTSDWWAEWLKDGIEPWLSIQKTISGFDYYRYLRTKHKYR